MRRLVGCVLGLCSFAFAQGFEVNVFSENGKVGLKNEAGEVLVPARYDALGWSDGSFSLVQNVTGYRLNGQWGVLHIQKQVITRPLYHALTPTGADGFIAARAINAFTIKYGLLDAAGKITIPLHYDGIRITGLRAIVFQKNGSRYEHGVVTLTDRRIIPLHYKSIEPLGTLRFAVQNFENKVALFTETGEALTPFTIDSIGSFHSDHAVVYQNLRQGLINRAGSMVAPPMFRSVYFNGEWLGQPFPVWKELTPEHNELQRMEADSLLPAGNQLLVWQAGHAGLLTGKWNPLVPVQFRKVLSAGNLWVARKGNKAGLLNHQGNELLPFRFDTLIAHGNLVRAVERPWGEPRWSLYDTFGIRKSKKFYQSMLPATEHLFVVQAAGFFGAIDRYGNETVACVYDSILQITSEKITVKFKGLYGIISRDDRWVLPPQPHRLEYLQEDRYLLYDTTATFLKNMDGQVIYFSNGRIRWNGQHLVETLSGLPDRLIDLKGREVNRLSEAVDGVVKVFGEQEGMRGILRDGRYGFIDAQGKLRVANRYEGIGFFSEGLAPVKILGRWGFVNRNDQVAINPNFDSVTAFSNQRALAARNGRWGVIDKTGGWVLQPAYDCVRESLPGYYLIESQKLCGLATCEGTVLIEPRFDSLHLLPGGHVLVSQQGQFGLLGTDGLTKIPMVYDALIFRPATQTFLARLPQGEQKIFP